MLFAKPKQTTKQTNKKKQPKTNKQTTKNNQKQTNKKKTKKNKQPKAKQTKPIRVLINIYPVG